MPPIPTIAEIDREIAELEALKPRAIGCDLYDGMVVCGGEMSSRIIAAGIASLIAQLEQQRADLGNVVGREQQPCSHLCHSVVVNGRAECFDCGAMYIIPAVAPPHQVPAAMARESALNELLHGQKYAIPARLDHNQP